MSPRQGRRRGVADTDDQNHGDGSGEVVLVTGFPSFTARRLFQKILATQEGAVVRLLVGEKAAAAAQDLLATRPESERRRVDVVVGDVSDMDLGLAGTEVRALADGVTTIHHLAGLYHLGDDRALAERVNIDGTRNVVEFAGDCRRLRRLCHWSTVHVSGNRKGVILEEELDEGQRFTSVYEETKFEAEKIARAAQRKLPVTVLRPGTIVGDSHTGEIDRFDGPYTLMVFFVESPLDLHLPLPGRGAAPMNLVPIDFVVDAALALSLDDRAAGGTFHLVDPSPFASRHVYELVAERAHKKRSRRFLQTGITRALLSAPGLERLLGTPLSFLGAFDRLAFYNSRHALALLRGTGIECPPFDTYVDNLIRYVREVYAARRRKKEDEVFDPFE